MFAIARKDQYRDVRFLIGLIVVHRGIRELILFFFFFSLYFFYRILRDGKSEQLAK